MGLDHRIVANVLVRLIERSARAERVAAARRMAGAMAPSDRAALARPVIGAAYGAVVTRPSDRVSAGPILEAALNASGVDAVRCHLQMAPRVGSGTPESSHKVTKASGLNCGCEGIPYDSP